MKPEHHEESTTSRIIFIGAILVLIIIIGACAYVIYDNMQPHYIPISTPTPTPSGAVSPTSLPTATPTPVPTNKPSPTANPYHRSDTAVTNGDGGEQYTDPGIYDHYIVYDMSDGHQDYSMLYDVNTKQAAQVASGHVFSYGAISNGKVMLYYPQENKITLYDIAAKRYDVVSTSENKSRGSITMRGMWLAYYQDNGQLDSKGNWVPYYCMYVFNMHDGSTSNTVQNLPQPLDIRIYDNLIVYTVNNGHGSDIYLLDLMSDKRIPLKITDKQGNNNHARIYDNYVVYHSDADGKNHIYIYNIKTGQTYMPAPSSSEQWSADIYGDTIVYDDNRNGAWNIYAYSISRSTERQITDENNEHSPVIYGDRIAYIDVRDGNIYTMSMS